MRPWRIAGLVAGVALAGWLAAVAVAVGVMVRGGRLIERASTEWDD